MVISFNKHSNVTNDFQIDHHVFAPCIIQGEMNYRIK
jgi:hypothetical protein